MTHQPGKKFGAIIIRNNLFSQCIHPSYYRAIENLDFNLRQQMEAGVYQSNCTRVIKLADLGLHPSDQLPSGLLKF